MAFYISFLYIYYRTSKRKKKFKIKEYRSCACLSLLKKKKKRKNNINFLKKTLKSNENRMQWFLKLLWAVHPFENLIKLPPRKMPVT